MASLMNGNTSVGTTVYQYSSYPSTSSDNTQKAAPSSSNHVVDIQPSPESERNPRSKKGQQESADAAEALILEKKRKNATAQGSLTLFLPSEASLADKRWWLPLAAFRARRSNYISNLEETVASLENVVRRLQDACRDAHDDNAELREENVRLQAVVDGFKQRESIWKAYAKATAGTAAAATSSPEFLKNRTHSSDSHSLPLATGLGTPPSSCASLDSTTHGICYSDDGTVYGDVSYQFSIDGKPSCGITEDQCPKESRGQSIRLYNTHAGGSNGSSTNDYTHNSNSSIPSTPSIGLEGSFGVTPLAFAQTSSPGLSYSTGPVITSPTDFATGYSVSGGLQSGGSSNYHHRRTLSDQTPSKIDFMGYTRDQANPASTGTTTGPTDMSSSESGSRSRSRRSGHTAFPSPLSPPPRGSARLSKLAAGSSEVNTVSNTLAVVRAQAFGGVRKTRARAKKSMSSGEAAKAAIEVLEARGLGLGLDIAGGVKRRKRGEALDSGSK
ncbi:hypothetical protein FRC02_000156 [Tulasnella sp. 418]|nr:hypothetical protein FRC02_000156 [Tulasnella sp. 418]